MTDAGRSYLKALGNKEGPQVLACEWVGTALADWFGLRTFAVSRLMVTADDEIELGHRRMAEVGPAVASRAEAGSAWGGSAEELRAVANSDDFSRLVVFDTWLLNCDRYPPDLAVRRPNYDNVFLSAEGAPSGQFELVAFDHTHCFTCGRELTPKVASIDLVKDARLYGNFPEFAGFLRRHVVDACVDRLSTLKRSTVDEVLAEIEPEWQVSAQTRAALGDLICERAEFLTGTIRGVLFPP